MSKFQITLIAVFIFFIVAGVAAFATFQAGNTSTQLPPVVIWGTLSADQFSRFVQEINLTRSQPLQVQYIQKAESSFNQDFVETLARGEGPDLVLISQDLLYKNEDKMLYIPFQSLTERDFRDTFIQEGELLLRANGIAGIPFSLDPLVMYWNRDTFTNAGIALYPRTWNEFGALAQGLVQKDAQQNIRRTPVALGEFRNVTHAREIFGTLLMQAGNPIIANDPQNGIFTAVVGNTQDGYAEKTQSALEFYTNFANPIYPTYAWNRALPESKNYFIAGNLATYFGFASEISDIRAKNPNLNFDIAPLPQAFNSVNRITYGKLYSFSIPKTAKDPNNSLLVIQTFVSPTANDSWSKLSYLPPVRRDLIAQGTTDPYLAIFYDGALIARGWLDPNTIGTNDLFQKMVESVLAGRESISQAVVRTDAEMELLLFNK